MYDERLVLGCDIARFGDDSSVVLASLGYAAMGLWKWQGHDLMETTGRIVTLFRALREPVVVVDTIGVGGGVYDRLVELGIPCVPVNVGEAAQDTERFFNRRAELYWQLREAFREGKVDLTRLPQEDYARLSGELAAILFEYTSRGQIKIEAKDEIKKRLNGHSPDYADAMMLTQAAQYQMIGINVL